MNSEMKISGIILSGIALGLLLIPAFSGNDIYFLNTGSGSGSFNDTTICSNVGSGKTIHVVGSNCDAKSLIGSSDISITNTSNIIIIDFNGTVSGESTECINVGTGTIVIKNSTSGNCFVKTFLSGTGITITNSTDTITITNTITTLDSLTNVNSPNPSTGDVLTFDTSDWKDWSLISLGIGATVYKGFDSSADQFQFRSLVQGSGINFVTSANDITISNTAQETTSCNNVGTGNQLCSGGNVNVDTLIAGDGITITDTTDDWTFARSRTFFIDQYVFQSVTKTNLPTTYTDVYVTAFDAENLTDTLDCASTTLFRVSYMWDFVGAGTDQIRFVSATDNNNVLFEDTTISADRDPDITQFATPAWCTGQTRIEMQAKSSNGTNDPIAKGYMIWAN